MMDTSCGFPVASADTRYKYANSSAAEIGSGNGTLIYPTATGISDPGNIVLSGTVIYLAIRRPNKPPTSGTQVYNAIARTGTGANISDNTVGFAPDLLIIKDRSAVQVPTFFDRLRGKMVGLYSSSTNAEQLSADATKDVVSFDMNGATIGVNSQFNINQLADTYIDYFFKRAPGVFDEVCYTGTGAAHTEAHNLGAVPEMITVKERDLANNWAVYHTANTNVGVMNLNDVGAVQSPSTVSWNSTTPTTTVFTVGTSSIINGSTHTFVAYLFASIAGISKVGSYTGNGSSQTIACGFAAGARFIMIKRTDNTGDWYIWDTVRGIIAGNDPHLSINTTAAEVTTDDSIDPDSSGFIVNQLAATNINVNAATYIFLAFA